MKIVTAYACEACGTVIASKEGCVQHEEMCRWEKLGHAVWIEDEVVKHASKVPEELYGPHCYTADGSSECTYGCGCWMREARSGGPVHPGGPCPMNIKRTSLKKTWSLSDTIRVAREASHLEDGRCSMCAAGDEPADGLHRGQYHCGNEDTCNSCKNTNMEYGDRCVVCGRIEKRKNVVNA